MAKLQSRSGTVHRVERLATPWGGAHGERVTALDLGGTRVRFRGTPSVGVGDLVTVVGYPNRAGVEAKALRNESTDVTYAASPWPGSIVGIVLLGGVAPWLGFPTALLLAPLGGIALLHSLRCHRARWLLDQQPSRHGAPVRAPRPATDHVPQT